MTFKLIVSMYLLQISCLLVNPFKSHLGRKTKEFWSFFHESLAKFHQNQNFTIEKSLLHLTTSLFIPVFILAIVSSRLYHERIPKLNSIQPRASALLRWVKLVKATTVAFSFFFVMAKTGKTIFINFSLSKTDY